MDASRAMASAAAQSNLQAQAQKQSKESYLKNMEALKDRTDLAAVNSTTLHATATMSASAAFR